MRFLADMGVAQSTAQRLREAGHDVAHLSELGMGRLSDREILELASREERIVLTFDLDFTDLLAAGLHQRPSVVIFRLKNQIPAAVTPRLLTLLTERAHELREGTIAIVEDARYRLRRLPILG
jgi:predicted nuclease of predicted toxin-antitoxin system